ncbi:hypothetical protein JQ557_34475 [Bradyrhizobium sp. U87765 SZCCT0131]|uniref:hypothetical protein n=1 Tax=unclassified Bradyrhizobium TaxID=2631580 RepID=UPI001BA572B2|nr:MULTISPECIES: hypothetical protein [unclassified Bradyrhizobium]MBR1223148.1 hypothetical protein [Bradyrhizobium sp. U87765 SZCCT0131]MBR1265726.1 hypothetical protein [Bradyrhizobium sp. U87765 SZCCT0134]MBR1309303.1 hypothetical protein [Bradyrhizobium sp. U87765 SZCCT0110]MBR1324131.1 hypothetical protein [Bradyrhizobium sp. U87765 SZCCT0109]MBR1352564.1 hypothetical protein [Bradyrhizobium sp. U87765 SZCCT0048]
MDEDMMTRPDLADQRIRPMHPYGERNRAKMTKAMIGLGLMFALSIVLSAVTVVEHWDARHPPGGAAAAPPGQGYDTAHLAPREDNSLH